MTLPGFLGAENLGLCEQVQTLLDVKVPCLCKVNKAIHVKVPCLCKVSKAIHHWIKIINNCIGRNFIYCLF